MAALGTLKYPFVYFPPVFADEEAKALFFNLLKLPRELRYIIISYIQCQYCDAPPSGFCYMCGTPCCKLCNISDWFATFQFCSTCTCKYWPSNTCGAWIWPDGMSSKCRGDLGCTIKVLDLPYYGAFEKNACHLCVFESCPKHFEGRPRGRVVKYVRPFESKPLQHIFFRTYLNPY